MLQLVWIRKLFHIGPDGYRGIDNSAPTQALNGNAEGIPNDDEKTALSYVPIYALGNLCVGEQWPSLVLSGVGLIVRSGLAVLLATPRLHGVPGLGHHQHRRSTAGSRAPPSAYSTKLRAHAADPPRREDVRRHRRSRLRGQRRRHDGRCLFSRLVPVSARVHGDLQRYRAPPSTLIQALTYALFPIAAASSSPFFGSILLYDVLAVFVGQRSVPGAGEWGTCLGWTALAMGGIVSFKGLSAWRRA